MSGWNKDAMNTMVEHIYHARRDTHANNLGNGTHLQGVGFGEDVAYPLWAHKATPEDYENQARMPAQPLSEPVSQGPSAAGAVTSSTVSCARNFSLLITLFVNFIALVL
jgi:hypothetical protein